MTNHSNLATSKLKEEKLQNVLEKVESYLQDRKQRQLLEFEIRHMTLEFEYSKDRIPVARKSLSKTIEDISEIDPRFITQQQKLSRLQKESEELEQEYIAFKARLEDLENKRSILPDLKAQIESMHEEVRMSSDSLKTLQSRYQEVLLNKENLGKETEDLKSKLSLVKNEIPVIKNTRDILLGCIPEGFDPEVYHSIQEKEEIEKSITSYVTEVKGEIKKIRKEISEFTTQIEEKDKEKEQLVSKKEHLQQKHEVLVAEVGDDSEKPIIEEEVNKLEGEKQRLAGESDQMTKEVSRLEAEIKRINDALERKKKVKADSMEQYTYLSSKKQEIEKFDNLEAVIEKLKKETEKHITDSKVNNLVIGVSSDIKQNVDSLNGRLQSAIEHYNRQFEELDRTITRLLS
jgi:chromosome segregation ATPase